MNNILTETKDRVLRIEIARPEKKNALTAGNDLKDFLERPPHSEAGPVSRF